MKLWQWNKVVYLSPARVFKTRPDWTSQIFTVLSSEPDNTLVPSGEKLTDLTSSEWPNKGNINKYEAYIYMKKYRQCVHHQHIPTIIYYNLAIKLLKYACCYRLISTFLCPNIYFIAYHNTFSDLDYLIMMTYYLYMLYFIKLN